MHNGIKPASQPRSLRGAAEAQADASKFPPVVSEEPQPMVDPADAAKPSSGQAVRGKTAADPNPFTLRGGR